MKKVLGSWNDERIKFLSVQDCENEIDEGIKIIEELKSITSKDTRQKVSVSKLKVGIKCGGSDGFSGITANAVVGKVTDEICAMGGTAVLTEVPEMFGAEELMLGERFKNNAVNVNQVKKDTGAAVFIPAKDKADLYGKNHIYRTCAYCRVSTDNDAQHSSFELQQEHYQNLADAHPNWDLKHIFADEGISGTSQNNRVEFKDMIERCINGEFNLIVTKSVSRFARNLVDCVSLARQLKSLSPPVGIFFETDNLFTLAEDSELKLSLLATFAQEESIKKSESMNWSLRERFKNKKLLTPELLGYRRPRDAVGNYIKYRKLEIEESEAEIVRFIYNAFLGRVFY